VGKWLVPSRAGFGPISVDSPPFPIRVPLVFNDYENHVKIVSRSPSVLSNCFDVLGESPMGHGDSKPLFLSPLCCSLVRAAAQLRPIIGQSRRMNSSGCVLLRHLPSWCVCGAFFSTALDRPFCNRYLATAPKPKPLRDWRKSSLLLLPLHDSPRSMACFSVPPDSLFM
jgi:hypothetical protein